MLCKGTKYIKFIIYMINVDTTRQGTIYKATFIYLDVASK